MTFQTGQTKWDGGSIRLDLYALCNMQCYQCISVVDSVGKSQMIDES